MQDDPNRKPERRGQVGSADGTRAIGDSIRQAFLTHMGEQQRQFATDLAEQQTVETGETRKR